MPLNADTGEKPGRLRDNEAASLTALLKGNKYSDTDCTKACSDTGDAADLQQRFARVVEAEPSFNPVSRSRNAASSASSCSGSTIPCSPPPHGTATPRRPRTTRRSPRR